MALLVRDIMTRDVFAVAPDTSLATVARLLSERHISGAPVIDAESRPVGVISRGDLMRPLGKGASEDPGKSIFYLVSNDSTVVNSADVTCSRIGIAADVMQRFVLSMPPDKSVMDAVRLMVADEVHRLLVVEEGKLVGILSSMDVMKALVSEK